MPETMSNTSLPLDPSPKLLIYQSDSTRYSQNYYVMGLIDINKESPIFHNIELGANQAGATIDYEVAAYTDQEVVSSVLEAHRHGYTQDVWNTMAEVSVTTSGGTKTGSVKTLSVNHDDDGVPGAATGKDYALYECRPIVMLSATDGTYFVGGLVDLPDGKLLNNVTTTNDVIVVNLLNDPNAVGSTVFIPFTPCANKEEYKKMMVQGQQIESPVKYEKAQVPITPPPLSIPKEG
jgi:hypothetical protein